MILKSIFSELFGRLQALVASQPVSAIFLGDPKSEPSFFARKKTSERAWAGWIAASIGTVVLGSASPAQAAIFTYDNAAVIDPTISDTATSCAAPLVVTFDVTDTFDVGELDVGLNLTHTYRGDIEAKLISPLGTEVYVTRDDGGSGDDFDMLLDNDATLAIGTAVQDVAAPLYDSVRLPNESLYSFSGEAALGTWTLEICDDASGDAGVFGSARLVFDDTPPAFVDISLNQTISNTTPTYDESLTITVDVVNNSANDAGGLTVQLAAPALFSSADISIVSATNGSASITTGLWTIGGLPAGQTATLVYTSPAKAGTGIFRSYLATSAQPDPDSSPGTFITSEDDADSDSVTTSAAVGHVPPGGRNVCYKDNSEIALDGEPNTWAKLSNPSYFGSGGSVAPEELTHTGFWQVTSSLLTSFDCDIWLGGGSPDEAQTESTEIYSWHGAGNRYIIGACDYVDNDICNDLRSNTDIANGGVNISGALAYNPIGCGGTIGVETYGGASTYFTPQGGDVVLGLHSPNGEAAIITDAVNGGSFVFLPDADMLGSSGATPIGAGATATTNQAKLVLNTFKLAVDEIAGRTVNSCVADYNNPPGEISGFVYVDGNGDNAYQSGTETPLQNVSVSIYGDPGTPADASDDFLVDTVDTNASGAYSFSVSQDNSYRIEVDTADNDLSSTTPGTENPLNSVTVVSGGTTPDQNFGFDPGIPSAPASPDVAIAACQAPDFTGVSPDGLEDLAFPTGYWAASYFEGNDGIVGSTGGWETGRDGTGAAGSKVFHGEAFWGSGENPVVSAANGGEANGAWNQNSTPTSGGLPHPSYQGSTWTSNGNPWYQIDFRRQIGIAGTLTIGGDDTYTDDSIEVFVNGTRVYAAFPSGGAPDATPNAATPAEISLSANDEVLVRYINLGWVGGYSFEYNVPGYDCSDAPTSGTSYGVASHIEHENSALRLGAANDDDTTDIASTNADGDGAEDDGVTLPSLALGASATIPVTVSGTGGYLQGWIDWDGDNNFTGTNDQIALNIQDGGTGDTDGAANGTIQLSVNVPADATTDQTFSRFRWSTTENLDSTTAATDGEVEDYAVTLEGNCTTVVTNVADSGTGSLRDAIICANGDPAKDEITFNIAGGGAHTITPLSPLPMITDDGISIDGSTQPGASCGMNRNAAGAITDRAILIAIDGTNAGTGNTADGLSIGAANGVTIKGMSIGNFDSDGINATGSTNFTAICNHIGLARDGLTPLANNDKGIVLDGVSGADIGDATISGMNVIGANKNDGIWMQGTIDDVIVDTNYIGIGSDGNTSVGNGRGYLGAGISFAGYTGSIVSDGEIIRNNVISGNGFDLGGFYGSVENLLIENNRLGTDATGLLDRTDQYYIIIAEDNNGWIIRDNVISGADQGSAIEFYNMSNTTIQGNKIGVGIDGTTPIGNGFWGVRLSGGTGNIVGGLGAGEGNIIAHNSQDAANGYSGILVQVGGTATITGNAIHSNQGPGVEVVNSGTQSVISRNEVYGNLGLGIDVGSTNVTLNDANDADTGPNDILNFPQFDAITRSGSTVTVTGCAPAGSTVELFESDISTGTAAAGDNTLGTVSVDYGEGQAFLASFVEGSGDDTDAAVCALAADADGNDPTGMQAFSFSFAAPASLETDDGITATATLAASGTSEFSANNLVASLDTDYSDAPTDLTSIDADLTNTYAEASHSITGLSLGVSVTSDTDSASQSSGLLADGDTSDDGVTFPLTGSTSVLRVGESNSISVNASGSGFLNAWIDWNQDGDWLDAGEQIATNQSVSAGNNVVNVTPTTLVPQGATYARFRLTSASVASPTPSGAAADGEVEDYRFNIVLPNTGGSCVASIGNLGFEDVSIAAGAFSIRPEATYPYWGTIASSPSDGVDFSQRNGIEIWGTGHSGVASYAGTHHAEINAYVNGTLYQDIVTTPGAVMSYSFAHRGRAGSDVVRVVAGPPGGEVEIETYSTGNTDWVVYSGSFTVPAGQNVTRFGFEAVSSAGGGATGNFIDDVYLAASCFDFGDAPQASYGSPSHTIAGYAYLGSLAPDFEGGHNGNANATGDNDVGLNDEDGVALPAMTQGQTVTIPVTVNQANANDGYLQGWIDWNGDGDFDDRVAGSREQIAIDLQSATPGASVINVDVTVPINAVTSQTYARFRWSTTSGLDATTTASDGEVEDYALTITAPAPPIVASCAASPQFTGQIYDSTGVSVGGGALASDVAGVPSLPVSISSTTSPNAGFDFAGYTGGEFRFSHNPSVAEGVLRNSFSFARQSPVRMRAGPSHGLGVSRMNQSIDTITFVARGASAGFTWVVNSIQDGAATISADGLSISIEAGPTTVQTEYDIASNGLLMSMDVTRHSRVVANDNTSFYLDAVTCYDLADAPFGGSAAHLLRAGYGIGSTVDIDTSLLASPNSDGDGADDDGVTIPALSIGGSGEITVNVAGSGGYLQAWIDFDGSGSFDSPVEQIATDMQDFGSGTISIPVTVPSYATSGQTFARFRWSTDFNIGPDGAASDGEVEDYAITFGGTGPALTGRVFIDNGSGATAFDGIKGGLETDSTNASISLFDGSSSLLATVPVDGDGTWSYVLPVSYTGPVTVTSTPQPGWITVSEQTTGLPSLSNPNAHDGSFTFTPSSGVSYPSLDIGLIPEPTLTQDQSTSIVPGQTVALAHRYEATGPASVTFSIVDIVQNPAGTFASTIYRDVGCDGTLDSFVGAPVSVVAGESVCLAVRTQAGGGAGPGSSLSYGLTASTAFTGTTVSTTLRNDDRIGSGGEELLLRKLVTNLSIPGAVEGTSNIGNIGDILQYRIIFTNPGSGPANDILVTDATPAYTALAGAIPPSVTVAPGITCALQVPAAGNGLGYVGPLQWQCPGAFPPGAEGSVTFQVQISP